jgi:TonB family protein
MSSAPAISNDNAKPGERRGFPREMLTHYVVLAFFGEDNWGKLTNLSESGMAIEFARPPSLRERANFTLQVMGCMPVPRDGAGLSESFEAAGVTVWLRGFERIAGVQFEDLATGSREQIRQWLSFETSTNALTSGGEAKSPAPPALTELLAPLEPAPAALSTSDVKRPLTELPTSEPEPPTQPGTELTPTLAEESQRVPVFELAKGTATQQPSLPHPPVARLTFLVVSGCLAAFAMTAGLRIYISRAAHRPDADAGERAAGLAERAAAPAGAVHRPTTNAAPLSAPVSSSAVSLADTAPPFQVEVEDVNGRRWMLWFVRNGLNKGDDQPAAKSAESPVFSESTSRATTRNEPAPQEKPHAPRTFNFDAPNLNRSPNGDSAASSPSLEAPAIPTELAVPSGEPIGGAFTSRVTPPAPVLRAPVGGVVQQARLIQSTPPVYPSLAKSLRISGDVVVDALVDADGRVKSAKVISGPDLLRQAAIETVRQWRYEPARLDGQAVAMHLEVTVKFRFN